MNYETIACPICSTIGGDKYRDISDIVKCNSCDLVYLRTRMTIESMEKAYQNYADDHSHMRLPKTVEEIIVNRLRRKDFVDACKSLRESPGRLLDIGCGWGGLLYYARLNGYSVEGIEITKKSVDFANNILGIKVYGEQLENCSIPRGVDVVTAYHSFEHLPNPSSALKKVHGLLNPKGWFCGVVPNIESMGSKTLMSKWDWLDPNMHYAHYSPRTLRMAIERNGFSVLRIFTTRGDGDGHKHDIEEAAKNAGLTVEEVDANGMGEEIWFFAQKV